MPDRDDFAVLAHLVDEAGAVVLINGSRAIGAWVDRQRQRRIRGFAGVLFHRARGDDRTGADIERNGLEVDRPCDPGAAGNRATGPEIVPSAFRQIECSACCAFLDYGRDQDIAAPEILVAAPDSVGIGWVVQPKRAHHRHAGLVRLAHRRVQVRQ